MEKKIRLFLVDDQKEIIDSIKLFVEASPNFEVVGMANSGKACIEKIGNYTVDIILMDIKMESSIAGMLSAELILKTRFSPKIIFLTTYSNKMYRKKAIKMGCSFIDKAFSIPKILNCIEIIFQDDEQMQVLFFE